jgi:hypothetical protein
MLVLQNSRHLPPPPLPPSNSPLVVFYAGEQESSLARRNADIHTMHEPMPPTRARISSPGTLFSTLKVWKT